MATQSRKGSMKVKPRKSQPKKSPTDRIVDQELGSLKEEFARRYKRADVLSEFFRHTVKLAWELFKINSELGYSPAELDQRRYCDDLQVAHEKLHEAARIIRLAGQEIRTDLRSEESTARDAEKQIRAREERSQARETTRKEVTKRLSAKAGGA